MSVDTDGQEQHSKAFPNENKYASPLEHHFVKTHQSKILILETISSMFLTKNHLFKYH